MTRGPGGSVYHPWSLRLVGALVTVMIGVLASTVAAADLTEHRTRDLIRAAAVSVALVATVYELAWRPAVRVTADGAVLVNPFRTVVVPWPALAGTDIAWRLRLITADSRHSSWAALGGPGVGGAWSTGRQVVGDQPGGPGPGGLGFPGGMGYRATPALRGVLDGEPAATLSGAAQAKLLVDRAWQAWQGGPHGPVPPTPAVVRSWHWRTIALIATTAAVAVLTGLG